MARQFATDPQFIEAFKRIAVLFLVRAGAMTEEEAKFELTLIEERIGFEKFVNAAGKGKFDNEPYILMQRIGATKRLNRKERINVSLTLSNAINHASIEAGYV